ncbi:hypothetical protein Tco_1538929 [Tanacetum coccineum]
MDGGRGVICFREAGSLDRIESGEYHRSFLDHRDHMYALRTISRHLPDIATTAGYSHSRNCISVLGTRFQMQQMVETLRVIRDMRREMSDMQAELLSLREQQRRARQPGPEARIPDHQDASGDADSHI